MSKSNIAYNYKLDSLRGIAAILVVLLHFSSYLFPKVGLEILAYTPLVKKSYLFVDLFFILSGYVLALNYFSDFNKGIEFKSYKTFIKKRFIRLYPLHLVTLLLLVVLYWGGEYFLNPVESNFKNITNPKALLFNLTLLQSSGLFARGCFECTSWNYPAWSISTEWIWYFFMPFLFLIFTKIKRLIPLILLVLLLGLYFLIERPLGNLDYASIPALYRCGLGICAGIFLYQIQNKLSSISSWTYALSILCLLGMHFEILDSIIVFLFILLVASVIGERKETILNSRPLIWLGQRSYSIYMIHAIIHLYFDFSYRVVFHSKIQDLSLALQFTGLVISCVILLYLSHLSYRFIELKLGKSLKNRIL